MPSIASERIKNLIKELSFFEEFTENDITCFVKFLSLRSVAGGTVLFNQGDIGDYLFFVLKGNIAIKIISESANNSIVANVGYGSSVGEMSLVDEFPRSATVLATEPSDLLVLTKNRFESIDKENPRIALKIIKGLAKNLSKRLRASSGRFADFT